MNKQEKETLQGIFENIYNEYTNYNKIVKKETQNIEEHRLRFVKFAEKNKNDIDVVLDELYRINEKPALYKNDLEKLQSKLVYTFDLVKNFIDIPEEIKKEVNALPRPKMAYKVDVDKLVDIDTNYNEQVRKQAQNQNREFVKSILQKAIS